MDFFFVEQKYKIEISIDGMEVSYLFLPNDPQNLIAERLYFAPGDEIRRVIERFKQKQENFEIKVILKKEPILTHPKFPLNLTYTGGIENKEEFISLESRVIPLLGRKKIRVAIINGMGGGIGDNLVGMSALNIFYDRLKRLFDEVKIAIFTLRPRGIPIIRQETIVDEIYFMPSPVSVLMEFDAYVDLSRMTGWPIFKQEMIDFYLQAMSIDPTGVPPEEKRCFVKLNERVARELHPVVKALKCSGRRLLLIHSLSSSPIRSIPEEHLKRLLSEIIKESDYLLVSLIRFNYRHPRLIFLDHLSGRSFDHYAYLVSQVDAIVTVDTATYHLADAFNIPTVVLFTSIPPEHRVSYYPFVKGIVVGDEEDNILFYKHTSDDPEDLKKLDSAWARLTGSKIIKALVEMEDKRARELPERPCPVCGTATPHIPTNRYRTYRHLRCSNCEAEFAWPRKVFDYEETYRKNDVTKDKHYIADRDPHEALLAYISQERFQKVKEFLEHLPEKKTLLDAGCAHGFFVKYALGLGFDAYGFDANLSAVSWGKKKFGLARRLSCTSSLMDLPEHFPRYFQVITAFELVEHLKDPAGFVFQVAEKLEYGGIFVFSTPNRESLGRYLGCKDERIYFFAGERDQPPKYMTRFSMKTHRYLVERAELKILFQWIVPPVLEDLIKPLGDEFKISNLNVDLGGQILSISGEKLKPLVIQSLTPFLFAFQNHGPFLITVAVKK